MAEYQTFEAWWDENFPNAAADEAGKLLAARAWEKATMTEREACALACEAQLDPDIERNTAYEDMVADTSIRECAKSIRARTFLT